MEIIRFNGGAQTPVEAVVFNDVSLLLNEESVPICPKCHHRLYVHATEFYSGLSPFWDGADLVYDSGNADSFEAEIDLLECHDCGWSHSFRRAHPPATIHLWIHGGVPIATLSDVPINLVVWDTDEMDRTPLSRKDYNSYWVKLAEAGWIESEEIGCAVEDGVSEVGLKGYDLE